MFLVKVFLRIKSLTISTGDRYLLRYTSDNTHQVFGTLNDYHAVNVV